jgi:hypothetical protein
MPQRPSRYRGPFRVSDQVLKPVGTAERTDPLLCACGCARCAATLDIPLSCARPQCSEAAKQARREAALKRQKDKRGTAALSKHGWP